MAKIVEFNGQPIEFPDDMPDSEIEKVLQTQAGVTPVSDVAPPEGNSIGRQLGLTGRGVAKSALSLLGMGTMIADPIQSALGMKPASKGIDDFLTGLGFPKPQGAVEENVQAGMEAGLSIGGTAKLGQTLTKPITGLFQPPSAAKKIAMTFSDDLGQQLAAGVPAAMTADFIANKAQETGNDPITSGAYALAGGLLAGYGGSSLSRKLTTPKIPLYTPQMAKEEAARSYAKVKQAGVEIKGQSLAKTVDEIQSRLTSAEGGLIPSIKEHGDVLARLDALRTVAKTGKVSFENLDALRSGVVTAARESTDPAQKRMLGMFVEDLDNKIANLQPNDIVGGKGTNLGDALSSVREARDAWRRGAKATILEDIIDVSQRRGEAPTASEGELIRNGFKTLYADKKKMKMFSKEEQEVIRQVVAGKGGGERVLALAARFNPQRNQLMAGGYTITGGYGLGSGSPTLAMAALAPPVVGYGADKALKAIQNKAAKNAMSQIASGQIPRPRSNQAWQALVQAEVEALRSQAEQQYQESQIAP
jgi:hypothetical protein